MSTTSKSTGKYWIYFLLSLAFTVALLIFIPEWCWVAFPFLCTYFVQAMDWM